MPTRVSSLAAVLTLALSLTSAALAGPLAISSTPAVDSYSFPLGNLKITALSDGTVPQDLHELLTDTTQPEVDSLLEGSFLQNPVEASINVYLIEDGERRILVDTGAGQLFGPGLGGKLLDGLNAIGIAPSDITDILITHVHTDHTGGLVMDGRPAFPNATVHVAASDLEFFLERENSEKTGYAMQYFEEAEKTVGAYEATGQIDHFDETENILPGIVATVHPGHTPGSAFFTVSSEGETMVFVGDLVHVAAVQFPSPQITIVYDVAPDQAETTRIEAFSDFADKRELIAAPHLPFPGVGHVSVKDDASFMWHPVEYRDRKAD